MTYLELVNEVLSLLREDEVATVTENTYSTLIGKFVNRAKYKVENAHNWNRLQTTIQITTAAGTYAYVLTGAGKRFKLLENLDGSPDVFNDTEDYFLNRSPSKPWMSQNLNENNSTQSDPFYFDFNGYTGSDPIVNLYPVPSSVQTINFNLLIPQDPLSAGSDILVVPDEPVIMEAYLMALRERGEDGGTGYMEQREEARMILSDEVAMDRLLNPEDNIWRVV